MAKTFSFNRFSAVRCWGKKSHMSQHPSPLYQCYVSKFTKLHKVTRVVIRMFVTMISWAGGPQMPFLLKMGKYNMLYSDHGVL